PSQTTRAGRADARPALVAGHLSEAPSASSGVTSSAPDTADERPVLALCCSYAARMGFSSPVIAHWPHAHRFVRMRPAMRPAFSESPAVRAMGSSFRSWVELARPPYNEHGRAVWSGPACSPVASRDEGPVPTAN